MTIVQEIFNSFSLGILRIGGQEWDGDIAFHLLVLKFNVTVRKQWWIILLGTSEGFGNSAYENAIENEKLTIYS